MNYKYIEARPHKVMTNSGKYTRPPMGIVPKFIRDEKRIDEIRDAIVRYLNENIKIPVKWVNEYNDLTGAINEISN